MVAGEVEAVELTEATLLACLCHAFSTEKEEIMGLLMGDFSVDSQGRTVARVWDLCVLQRSDRRKDRVEISPEQLAAASSEAERITNETGRMTNVVGWYHSHPKITVWPSHVDVRTQADYQAFDRRWIGLIFAVFYRDTEQLNRLQITAFQSKTGNNGLKETFIPIDVTATPGECAAGPLRTLQRLPEILFDEERATHDRYLAAALKTSSSELQAQLLTLHHGSVYVKSLTSLIDKLCGPILQLLDQRQRNVEAEIERLETEKLKLKSTAEDLL